MLDSTRRFADKVIKRIISFVPTRSVDGWDKRHERRIRADVERLARFVPPDGFFLDIGCNIGTFSHHMRRLRPGARGIAFEPVALYAERARERFAGDPMLEVVNVGLGNVDEERTIYKAPYNPGGNTLLEEAVFDDRPNSVVNADEMEREVVRLRNVSSFLDERGIERIDLVKTDTEGYDWAVMDGFLPWLRRTGQRPAFFIEVFTASYFPKAVEQQAAFDAFFELGYGRVDIEECLTDGFSGDALLVHGDARASRPAGPGARRR